MKKLIVALLLLFGILPVAAAQDATGRPPITIDNAPQVNSVQTLDGHLTQVMAIDFSDDGALLASGALDRIVRVWDTETWEPVTIIDQDLERIWHTSISADGSRVASVHRAGSAYIWDTETGEQLHHMQGHIGDVTAVSFSLDGNQLYTAGSDLTLQVWDTETGESLHVFDDLGFEALRIPLDIQPVNDELVAISTGELGGGMSQGTHPEGCPVMIVNTSDGTIARQLEGIPCNLWGVAIHAEEGLMAVGDGEGVLHIADLETAEITHSLEASDEEMRRGVAFSSDGRLLASAGFNGKLQLWDVESGSMLSEIDSRSPIIQSIAFSPDDTSIVTGNFDGTLEVWAVSEEEPATEAESETVEADTSTDEQAESGDTLFPPRELPGVELELGESYFTLAIKINVTQRLTYEGTAGEELILDYNAFGVTVTVTAPDGEVLAELDSTGKVNLVLPSDGQYEIKLFGESGGAVTITLRPAS